MSNKGTKKVDSIYTTSDDPMLGEDQETEETGFDLTGTEDQERVHSFFKFRRIKHRYL